MILILDTQLKNNNRMNTKKYQIIAKGIRKKILEMIHKTKSPHIGSCLSIVEVLVALYFKYLKINLENPYDKNRDRLILSKGHASAALYAVLSKRGFIKEKELKKFSVNNGIFEQHPNQDIKRGIEISTGSLGHGLSIGTGMALSAKNDRKKYKIYVVLSDGELNEGSVWEAVMFAAQHKLDNLVAIIDCNKIQALGYTRNIINMEPLSRKWLSFGWGVKEIDGHNFGQIFKVLGKTPFSKNKPSIIISNTLKGKGVSFMEDKLLWHYRSPNDEEYRNAMRELNR